MNCPSRPLQNKSAMTRAAANAITFRWGLETSISMNGTLVFTIDSVPVFLMVPMKSFVTSLTFGLIISLIPVLAGCSGVVEQPSAARSEAPKAGTLAPELFERVAMIGASSSAGFNLQLETGVPTRLADFIDQALLVPHAISNDGATELLFMDPESMGADAVTGALSANPSLVIAPDFLFWFFYGRGRSDADRRARLEVGLALLDPIDCPLVIGEIPFMAEAAGGMIPHSSMPAPASFSGANERIHAWAAARPSTAVVPLVDLHETLKSGAVYEARGALLDPADSGGLLQADHLHPNMVGTAVLALEVLAALAQTQSATLEGVALADPEEIADLVDDLVSSR